MSSPRPEPLDLLVVAAHPDDAELAVGGILLLAADAGLRTGVLDLTGGERGTRGSRELRAAEAAAAAERLGLAWRGNLDLGDARLVADLETREALARSLATLRPTTVLGHTPSDRVRDLHPDHAAAGDLCRDACFLAGLTRLVEGPAHRPERLLHFLSHEVLEPDLVVDVSSVWPRKLEAVGCYRSQLPGPTRSPGLGTEEAGDPSEHLAGRSDIVERAETWARFWGGRVGATHGEPLITARPLRVEPRQGPGSVGLIDLFTRAAHRRPSAES
jgi:bacillithiol biosynthesis deacetylase BshB1